MSSRVHTDPQDTLAASRTLRARAGERDNNLLAEFIAARVGSRRGDVRR